MTCIWKSVGFLINVLKKNVHSRTTDPNHTTGLERVDCIYPHYDMIYLNKPRKLVWGNKMTSTKNSKGIVKAKP